MTQRVAQKLTHSLEAPTDFAALTMVTLVFGDIGGTNSRLSLGSGAVADFSSFTVRMQPRKGQLRNCFLLLLHLLFFFFFFFFLLPPHPCRQSSAPARRNIPVR